MIENALSLHQRGMNVIPLQERSKAPLENYGWKIWTKKYQSVSDVSKLFDGHAGNLGVICGGISKNLAVLDCDTFDSYNYYKEKLSDSYGYDTGRGGHIYLRTEIPARSKVLKTEHGKVEIRSNGLYVMSEGSIHPNTGVIYTSNGQEIKTVRIANLLDDGFEPDLCLTPVRQTLEESGYYEKDYSTRSEKDMAMIMLLHRKGFEKGQIAKILLSSPYESKFKELYTENKPRAEAWLNNALEKAQATPHTKDFLEIQKELQAIKDALVEVPFCGREGISTYKMLLSHIDSCQSSGKRIYHYSVREGSEKTGLSTVTVNKFNNKLEDEGYVKLVEKAEGRKSNAYSLDVKRISELLPENGAFLYTQNTTPTVSKCVTFGTLGLFEALSYGHSANQIFNLLDHSGAARLSEIVSKTGRSKNTVIRVLQKLEKAGILVKENNLYKILDGLDLTKFSIESGFIAKAIKRRNEHVRQRDVYRRTRRRVSPDESGS